uniref:Dynamin-type G domain-containing protein n=1 Tax=Panagrolaimus sp. ES5 TaxID=591445 RepID=A0AC34GEA0_9BILA
KDIEQLVKTYIEKKNCIILVVTQATQDFNTSLSLKLAKEVDPQHSRTLCVLTKIDTLKEPSKAKKILSGEIIKFKHGIIGVVNRSKTEKNKSLQTCLDDEQDFFKKSFHGIAQQMHGIYYLRVKLNKLLERHIKDCLPKFREEFDREIAEQQKLFDSYGSPITEENKHRVMNESIADFCNIYKSRLSGTASEVNKWYDLEKHFAICYINQIRG